MKTKTRFIVSLIVGLTLWVLAIFILCSNTSCSWGQVRFGEASVVMLKFVAASIFFLFLIPESWKYLTRREPERVRSNPHKRNDRSPKTKKIEMALSPQLKAGASDIVNRVFSSLNSEKGVHIESALAILGSLAGYSCHVAVWEELVESGRLKESDAFTIVRGSDGKTYYYGDAPNAFLATRPDSILSWVSAIVQRIENDQNIDFKPIFSRVASSVGSESFGIPMISEDHKPGDTPINYVKHMWPTLLPIIDRYCKKPDERPILLGIAIQIAIDKGKEVLKPSISATLAMECAKSMSKIGKEWIE